MLKFVLTAALAMTAAHVRAEEAGILGKKADAAFVELIKARRALYYAETQAGCDDASDPQKCRGVNAESARFMACAYFPEGIERLKCYDIVASWKAQGINW